MKVNIWRQKALEEELWESLTEEAGTGIGFYSQGKKISQRTYNCAVPSCRLAIPCTL
jgi:hypothetical protein